MISGNAGRLGKELWTDLDSGDRVRLIGHWDGEEEARWIGEEVEAMQRGSRGSAPSGLRIWRFWYAHPIKCAHLKIAF